MSDVSDEEDSIDKIDFSVISTALETTGNTLDQILNAVHYGTPELRHLLRESCDFIFECKYCKNLFRAIPNFIAHKRIYCGEKSFFPRPVPKKKKQREEVVVVRPVSPSLSGSSSSKPPEGEKTVLEQILTGAFQGNSEAYKHYTEAAENVEKHKMNAPITGVKTSSIQNTDKAVNVEIVNMPESPTETSSNASAILAKAKKSQKPPLTKIVDVLKHSAKTTSNIVKAMSSATKTSTPVSSTKTNTPVSPTKTSTPVSSTKTSTPVSSTKTSTPVSSPKKTSDKKTVSDSTTAKNKPATSAIKANSNTSSPQKIAKLQSKIIVNDGKKILDRAVALEQMIRSGEAPPLMGKSAKVVLKPLLPMMDKSKSQKEITSTDITVQQESKSTTTSTTVTLAAEKKQVSKLASTNDLRPVKTQNGSELSELSQLGHCDLKQLKCLLCNLQYSQKKTLLQHMHVIHSGSKTKYPCNLCSRTFDYFWGLTRHLLLNHKKTKEEIDKMRTELRALAYTKTDDISSSQKGQLEKQGSTSHTTKVKTLLKLISCKGCQKSFWKKSNYEEHVKQCRFFSTLPSPSKELRHDGLNKEKVVESSVSRRQRVLDKLAESRKQKEELGADDDTQSEKSGYSGYSSRSLRTSKEKADKTQTLNSSDSSIKNDEKEDIETLVSMPSNLKLRASSRMRIGGKFVTNEKAKILLAKQKEGGNDEEKERNLNTNKNKVVKKLKEKSRSFVPAQRFISTRRSAEFYHSPAQRTRFHDKRRAVVESPKKDSRSPTKTPTKANINETVSSKKSPEEKSELEMARRNLLNAINKGKAIERDSSPEKSRRKGSPVQRRSVEKKRQSNSAKTDANKTLEIERSRSTRRKSQKNLDDSSDMKLSSKTPSRDTSVDSIASRQSSRSRRDMSVESVRSRQSIDTGKDTATRSQQKMRSVSLEGINRSQERKSSVAQKSNLNEQLIKSKGEQTESKDSETDLGNNETGGARSKLPSRDSSRENNRTRSNENISASDSRTVGRLSETEDVSGKRTSANSEKQGKDKNIEEKLKRQNDHDVENHYGTRLSEKVSQGLGSGMNTGKDEIDGLRSGAKSLQKAKPKWSSKNWNSGPSATIEDTEGENKSKKKQDNNDGMEDNTGIKQKREGNNGENTVKERSQMKKTETERESEVSITKDKSSVDKEKLKGVVKHKIIRRRPRYPKRLMKTRLQVMKKSGGLKKRYPTRINDGKKEESNTNTVKSVKDHGKKKVGVKEHKKDQVGKSTAVKVSENKDASKSGPETEQKKQSPNSEKNDKSTNVENNSKRGSAGKARDEKRDSQSSFQSKSMASGKVDAGQQADVEKEAESERATKSYSHRQRHPSDTKGVKVIEEIWVSKEPGQPLQLGKCKKTIIESPKKVRSTRMYVVDPVKPEKPKCMDFSRINHLVDYKKNKCLQCGLELTDISSLRRHAVRHLGWKRYKCKLCAYTGFNRSECNSHIKRRHAVKLVSSSAPISTFIIDLNKEASQVRNKKKQSTLQKKNIGSKKSEQASTSAQGRVISLRKRTRKTENEEEEKTIEKKETVSTFEKKETGSTSMVKSISNESLKDAPVGRKTRSLSGHQSTSTSPQTVDTDDHSKLTRKRKRAVSEEGPAPVTKSDESITEKITVEEKNDGKTEQEEKKADNDDWVDEDIGSVSDYDDNSGEAPPRNVVSPTFIKMNPNVALMMATLEAARNTKFSRGKRGRGGIRRFSSPLKKHPRLSTEGQEDEDDEMQSLEDKRDESQEAGHGDEESKTGENRIINDNEAKENDNMDKSSANDNEDKPEKVSCVAEECLVDSAQPGVIEIKNETDMSESSDNNSRIEECENSNEKTDPKQSNVADKNTENEQSEISAKDNKIEMTVNSDQNVETEQSEKLVGKSEIEHSKTLVKNTEIEQLDDLVNKTDADQSKDLDKNTKVEQSEISVKNVNSGNEQKSMKVENEGSMMSERKNQEAKEDSDHA